MHAAHPQPAASPRARAQLPTAALPDHDKRLEPRAQTVPQAHQRARCLGARHGAAPKPPPPVRCVRICGRICRSMCWKYVGRYTHMYVSPGTAPTPAPLASTTSRSIYRYVRIIWYRTKACSKIHENVHPPAHTHARTHTHTHTHTHTQTHTQTQNTYPNSSIYSYTTSPH